MTCGRTPPLVAYGVPINRTCRVTRQRGSDGLTPTCGALGRALIVDWIIVASAAVGVLTGLGIARAIAFCDRNIRDRVRTRRSLKVQWGQSTEDSPQSTVSSGLEKGRDIRGVIVNDQWYVGPDELLCCVYPMTYGCQSPEGGIAKCIQRDLG